MPLGFALFAIVLVTVGCSNVFTIVKHPVETGARCLDGSPAALYHSVGSDENKNKFVIYFEGGGVCTGANLSSTLDSCYKRSLTALGSSSQYPATRSGAGQGILSGNATENPHFFDWTRIYIPYCDGAEHQGSRLQPISYKGADLYFRGTNNSIQQFESLNKLFGLYSADKVVLTGVSAGGMAVYYWSNYLYDRSQNKQVYSVPDSGLFLISYVNPFTGTKLEDYLINLLKLMDGDVSPAVPECEPISDPMECFNANRIAPYLRSPFFVIESQYDLWSIENILQLKCAGSKLGTLTKCNQTEVKAIEDYRTALLSALNDFNVIKEYGIWAPSCIQHGFVVSSSFNSPNYQVPSGSGVTLSEAIWKFVENPSSGKNRYVDSVAWPNNKGCSNVAAQPNKLESLRNRIRLPIL